MTDIGDGPGPIIMPCHVWRGCVAVPEVVLCGRLGLQTAGRASIYYRFYPIDARPQQSAGTRSVNPCSWFANLCLRAPILGWFPSTDSSPLSALRMCKFSTACQGFIVCELLPVSLINVVATSSRSPKVHTKYTDDVSAAA